jgi:hypothetical protein
MWRIVSHMARKITKKVPEASDLDMQLQIHANRERASSASVATEKLSEALCLMNSVNNILNTQVQYGIDPIATRVNEAVKQVTIAHQLLKNLLPRLP